MKAIKVRNLFGCIPDWEYYGEEATFTYNDVLYMRLADAYDWYIVKTELIEDIDYETV